ncbi:tetratricopeptide repeat protein [Lentzea sp.]|uniref:tetratricopeptide repeat protein n=1 Tax=Lentzea sp. TaxID=56099 RepID=UPI002ED3AF97
MSPAPEPPDTLTARAELAESKAHAGDFRGAVTEFRALVKERTAAAGPDDLQTLSARLNLARVLGTAKQFSKAIGVCEPLLRDQVRVLGTEHADTLETRQLLANLRYQTGDAEGAAEELERLLAALSHLFLPTHDRITKVQRDIAFLKRSS